MTVVGWYKVRRTDFVIRLRNGKADAMPAASFPFASPTYQRWMVGVYAWESVTADQVYADLLATRKAWEDAGSPMDPGGNRPGRAWAS